MSEYNEHQEAEDFAVDEEEESFNLDDEVEVNDEDETSTEVESYNSSGVTPYTGGDLSVSHSTETTVTVVHLDDQGVENTQIIDLASPPLTQEEAVNLTNNIRTQTNVLYLLIARAHAGKAHLALGYSSFEAYIKEEFNYSKSYAYKLINQSNVINAIQEVMPDGAQVYVSDSTARGLKASLGEFIPELEERVSDLPPTEAGEVMEDLIQQYRERGKEESLNDEGDDADDEFEGEYSGNGNGGGGDYEYSFDDETDDEDEEFEDAFGGEDPAVVRRKLEAVYNLYSTLGQFAQMPPNNEIIEIIPVERRPQVTAYLDSAITWLAEFHTDWVKAIESSDSEDTGSDDNDSDFDEDDNF